MIVKDEASIIQRCLESVRPIVDTWVIVDTGSSDGTQERIRQVYADVPGELHERPWKNFGENRTEALRLADGRADYLLVIDADEVLEVPAGYQLPPLHHDAYQIRTEYSGTSYYRTQVMRSGRGFRYEGVLHEVIVADGSFSQAKLDGLRARPLQDGARSSDSDKFQHDAEVLEAALEKQPDHARYVFYLAQSYRDAGQHGKALEAYRRRIALGGWDEEVWYSMYQEGALLDSLGAQSAAVLEAYVRAFEFRPTRAEPLCALSRRHRARNEYASAYLFAKPASEMPRPADILFLDVAVYEWQALDECAIAAYYVGRVRESLVANDELLGNRELPEQERARVERNRRFCLDALAAESRGVKNRQKAGRRRGRRA